MSLPTPATPQVTPQVTSVPAYERINIFDIADLKAKLGYKTSELGCKL